MMILSCHQDSIFRGLVNRFQGLLPSDDVVVEHSGKLAALAVILDNIFTVCPQEKVVLVSNHTKVLDTVVFVSGCYSHIALSIISAYPRHINLPKCEL
jgi:hypothetical protein